MAVLRERSFELPEGNDWWADENEDRAGDLVCGAARQINEFQRWRITTCQRLAAIFAGHPDGNGVNSGTTLAGQPITMTRNVCAQAVRTVVPKCSKHRPLPRCLTNVGEWKDNKRARKMTQYLEGIFKKKEIFEKHWDVMYTDAAVFGDGLLKIEPRGKGINVERVFPADYLVDTFDGKDGNPRCSYHVHTMDLGVALFRYGKKRKGENESMARARRDALREAATSVPDPNWDTNNEISSSVKRVRLVHAWHICSDEDAHEGLEPQKHECDGRRCTAILGTGFVLELEEWDWPSDPIHQLQWESPQAGTRGIGLVRRLEGWQRRITRQADAVDDGHRIGGRVAVITSSNSNVLDEEISNAGAMIKITYDGMQPPIVTTMPTVDPSVAQREAGMVPDALNEQGISLQSAAGQKHPGVNAGIAIEQLAEIEDEHWVPLGHAAERVALKMAKSFIRCMVRIAKEYGEDSTLVPIKMRDGYVKLRWADVSLNDFQVEVFPSSVLPQRPANRLEKLRSMFLDGLIDRQTFLQQLGAPDLTAEIDIVTAGRVAIDEMLEAVLDAEGDEELAKAAARAMPTSYLDFKWMQVRSQLRMLKAQMDNAPAANCEALKDICDSCEVLKEEERAANAPPMPPPMGMGAPPMGPMGGPPMGGPPGMPPGAPMMGGAPPMGAPPVDPMMNPMMGAA